MRLSFLVYAILFFFNCTFGQLQHPPSLQWNKIETDKYKIIFAKGNEYPAQKAANLLQFYAPKINQPLETEVKKIPLLLKSESVISNGYVRLAPRYMAWYLTPFQNVSSTLDGSDWLHNLAVHEYRHVAQFSKLDDEFTDVISDLTGDFGKSILMAISTPTWFFEGDAIWAETQNSYNGRGRMPSFFRDNVCLELENIRYSYDKSYLGSYKDFTPDHYHLGYLLTSFLNLNYGTSIWPQLLHSVSSSSYSPFTFSRNLKKETGNNIKSTYYNMLDSFRSIWEEAYVNDAMPTAKLIQPDVKTKYWTNYTYPFAINNEDILTLKYGLSDISGISIFKNGKEKTLKKIEPNERIHSNGKMIVWAQVFHDIRWGERSYSDIVIYDLKTEIIKRLTKKQKFYAPAISHDGKKIAAIEFTDSATCSLVIFDAISGNLINSYPFEENTFARMPSWSDDNEEIVLTLSIGQEKYISIIDIEEKRKVDIPFGTENISNPIFYQDFILFNSPLTGIDEIHAITPNDRKRYAVIKSKYGVYNPSIDVNTGAILFQEYTKDGFRIKEIEIDTSAWERISINGVNENNYLYKLFPLQTDVKDAGFNFELDTAFETQAFSPLLNSIFIHSWHPVIGYKSTGARLYSNDILNTTSVIGGIDYFPKEIAHREYVNISYSKYYPVFSAEVSYGQKYELLTDKFTNEDVNVKLNEKLVAGNISIPLDLSRGIYSNSVLIGGTYFYSWQHYKTQEFYLFDKQQKLSAAIFNLSFNLERKKAIRDINPKFGQLIDFEYTHSLSQSDYLGKRYVIKSDTYLPGLINHHSTRLFFGKQNNWGDYINSIYLLNSDLKNVRGYQNYLFESFNKFTFDYTFPFIDPDLSLGSLLYTKRIYGSVFYDMGNYYFGRDDLRLESIGLSLNFETFFFRIPLPFEIGIRYSRRLLDNKNSFEILLFQTEIM